MQTGDTIMLDAQAAAHVARVLRLKLNDQIIVFNGKGDEYLGVIESIDKRSLKICLKSCRQPHLESPLQITLVQGVSRSERMDYTLQKSVELGVNEIFPVTTQHMSVRLNAERIAKKQTHWQGVVNSACEQSGRVLVPVVHSVLSLHDCVEKLVSDKDQLLLMLDHRSTSTLPELAKQNRARVSIVVGPEGGLSEEEKNWLIQQGFIAVAMGPRVLRTETAALAAISIMQSLWGDFK
jgi:16S rRNA (uracil1498-N3)-methyltransferase